MERGERVWETMAKSTDEQPASRLTPPIKIQAAPEGLPLPRSGSVAREWQGIRPAMLTARQLVSATAIAEIRPQVQRGSLEGQRTRLETIDDI